MGEIPTASRRLYSSGSSRAIRDTGRGFCQSRTRLESTQCISTKTNERYAQKGT